MKPRSRRIPSWPGTMPRSSSISTFSACARATSQSYRMPFATVGISASPHRAAHARSRNSATTPIVYPRRRVRLLHPAQGNGVANKAARHVWRRAEGGIAHDVEIGKPGESERLADTATTGAFQVEEDFRFAAHAKAAVHCRHARSRALLGRTKAIRAAVGGRKGRMPLIDDIQLPREPPRSICNGLRGQRDGAGEERGSACHG